MKSKSGTRAPRRVSQQAITAIDKMIEHVSTPPTEDEVEDSVFPYYQILMGRIVADLQARRDKLTTNSIAVNDLLRAKPITRYRV